MIPYTSDIMLLFLCIHHTWRQVGAIIPKWRIWITAMISYSIISSSKASDICIISASSNVTYSQVDFAFRYSLVKLNEFVMKEEKSSAPNGWTQEAYYFLLGFHKSSSHSDLKWLKFRWTEIWLIRNWIRTNMDPVVYASQKFTIWSD